MATTLPYLWTKPYRGGMQSAFCTPCDYDSVQVQTDHFDS